MNRNRFFDFDNKNINPGNPWWIAVNGKPTESTKDLNFAQQLVQQKVDFFARYDLSPRPVIDVYRFYPFLGFVLQERRVA